MSSNNVRYEEDRDRYIADDTYVIRRRTVGDDPEWQIKHISSLTWTSADTILAMADAIRKAQEHYTEEHAASNDTEGTDGTRFVKSDP